MKKIYLILVWMMVTSWVVSQPNVSSVSRISDPLNQHQWNSLFLFHKMIPDHGQPDIINLQVQPVLKSAVSKQKLDSMAIQSYDTLSFIWKPGGVDRFYYDVNGRNTNYSSWSWDSEKNKMVGDYKTEYLYDNQGYLTEYSWSEWDEEAAMPGWKKVSRVLYTYNANHSVKETISYYWDDDAGSLVKSNKVTYTYDSKGNNTVELNYGWDSDINDWTAFSKTENTYDSKNNLTKSDYSLSFGESLMLYYSYSYTYNSNGDLIQKIHKSLDFMTFSLANSDKEEYTYNGSGDNTQVINFLWDSAKNNWVNSEKEENTFDSNHRVLVHKEFSYNEGAWIPTYMEENTYDSNGNVIQITSSESNNAGGLVNESKTEIKYNHNYGSEDLLYPYIYAAYISEMPMNMITTVDEFNWKDNQWRPDTKSTYHYSAINVTSAEKLQDNPYLVYPNPVSDQIHVITANDNLCEARLIDISGKTVVNIQFRNQLHFKTENLNPGMYILKIISSGQKDYLKKMIVR